MVNAEMDHRYHAGEATPEEFCGFYAALFAGLRTRVDAVDAFLVERCRVVLTRRTAPHSLARRSRSPERVRTG